MASIHNPNYIKIMQDVNRDKIDCKQLLQGILLTFLNDYQIECVIKSGTYKQQKRDKAMSKEKDAGRCLAFNCSREAVVNGYLCDGCNDFYSDEKEDK